MTVKSRAAALIEEISKYHPKGYDLGLARIEHLLAKLQHPQQRIPPVFHVAGTNGKGSTLAFLRAILEAHGKKVHVHTSPHLINWHERYRLCGKLADDDTLAGAIEKVWAANAKEPITVFELLCAVMFLLFSEHKADYALVEVGLGGRLDATNVIASPLVSVITPVSLDHEAWLGDTIAKIAAEKGGIIKPGCPVVLGNQTDGARAVLEEIASAKDAALIIQNQDFQVYEEQGRMIYQDTSGLFDLPLPSLPGEHQLENAGTAIAAARAGGLQLENSHLSIAMQSTVWPGRFQKLTGGAIVESLSHARAIFVDGGHNPAAGMAIANTLSREGYATPVLVCGMLDTKQPKGFFAAFGEQDVLVLTVPLTTSQAAIPADQLAEVANQQGLKSRPCQGLKDAIEEAGNVIQKEPGRPVVFCGSLYLAGEVLKLNGTPPE